MLPGGVHGQMLQLCEKATEEYRQMSQGRNHYLICYSCFKNEYFRKDQYKEWCTLTIRCPQCLKHDWLALGTNVSHKIIRTFEGVIVSLRTIYRTSKRRVGDWGLLMRGQKN